MFKGLLVFVGTVTTLASAANPIFPGILGTVNDIFTQTGNSFLGGAPLGNATNTTTKSVTFEVSLSNGTTRFKIGKQNDTLYLTPAINANFVAINAANCSTCGPTPYNSSYSEWLRPGMEGLSN